jgi:hypothetical protein
MACGVYGHIDIGVVGVCHDVVPCGVPSMGG